HGLYQQPHATGSSQYDGPQGPVEARERFSSLSTSCRVEGYVLAHHGNPCSTAGDGANGFTRAAFKLASGPSTFPHRIGFDLAPGFPHETAAGPGDAKRNRKPGL